MVDVGVMSLNLMFSHWVGFDPAHVSCPIFVSYFLLSFNLVAVVALIYVIFLLYYFWIVVVDFLSSWT